MTQHLHGYSGQNYDRWVQRNTNSSTLGKVQKQFWFTKSAVIRRLGKKEDEHVVASDAELDAKIELFKAIEMSTKNLQALLAEYQNKICVMAQEENALGRLLKEQGKQDRTRAGKVMSAAGKSLSYTAQQRVALRNPLVRLFQEVDTFYTRAVEDTAATVAEMEKVRTEYRGALMWMKNVSQDFNPDQHSQLEKFREVQGTVKVKKAKFDRIKLKSLQKIDLLAASRCNMFSHALIVYQNSLVAFSEKAAKTMNSVANSFKGHQPYQFTVIRELAEMPLEEEEEQETKEREGNDDNKEDTDKRTFFNAEYQDRPKNKTKTGETKASESLTNLLECDDDDDAAAAIGSSHLVDLLGPEMELPRTESETQKLLKELFDSPVRQPLPVFGSCDVSAAATAAANATTTTTAEAMGPGAGAAAADTNPFAAQQQQQQQQQQQYPQNMFLPSQLLDFGLDWQHQAQQQQQLQQLQQQQQQQQRQFGTTTAATTTTGATATATGTTTATPRPTNTTTLKEEVQKLDWYKVFQDIDPLADPANALFSPSANDMKQC